MKNMFARLALAAALGSLLISIQPLLAQGTAFTYQGRLNASGNPANGNYDMVFALFDGVAGVSSNQIGPSVTNTSIGVTNGLFIITLDFGAVFTGTNYWLDISVRTNGNGAFTELTPRQQLTPTPYALFAADAGSAATATTASTANSVAAVNITGTVPLAQLPAAVVTNNETGVTLSGTFTGNGGGLTNLNVSASQLTSIGNTNGPASGNFFVGPSGNATTSGSYNTAVGQGALNNNTTGGDNTANGSGALANNTSGLNNTADGFDALDNNRSGQYNTADGQGALNNNISGQHNTAIGAEALFQLGVFTFAGGSNNIALGSGAGDAFRADESSNIDIGNFGVTGDNNTIRIGDPTMQTTAYIAGVINGNGGGLTNLTVSASQLTSIGNTNGPASGNFFVGPSGNATTSGSYNTAVGQGALNNNTTGGDNTANGSGALANNTSGLNNTADGFDALDNNRSGQYNTADGQGALNNNISGQHNTAIGAEALFQLGVFTFAGGSNNIALGSGAGDAFRADESSNIDIGNFGVTGDNNTIRIGDPTMQTTTYIAGVINGNGGGLSNLNPSQLSGPVPLAQLPATVSLLSDPGTQNFFAGQNAGNVTLSGAGNTGVGFAALEENTSGAFNTAMGLDALYENSTGTNNSALGAYALEYNTTGKNNTGTGAYALSAYNVPLYVIGAANTADGAYALAGDESGSSNTAVGYQALYANTNGNANTASGVQALYANTSGTYNTASGYQALFDNTNGGNNTANGYQALFFNTSGTYNTASGSQALFDNTTGYENTANGVDALGLNAGGHDNTASGAYALEHNTSGTYNAAIGYNALEGVTSGSTNIGVGDGAGINLTTENNNIDIGNQGVAADSGVIRIGTPGTQTLCYLAGTVYANGTFVSASDRNAKENFKSVDPRDVLEKVAAIPVSRWNYKQDATSEHIGPMAQDFYAAFNVGPDNKHITTVDEGGVALAAIQGLNQKLDEKDAEIEKLKAKADKVDALEKQNDSLAARLNELEAAVKTLAEKK